MTAARRAADTLVERLFLTPPVDIATVITSYADLEVANWPYTQCDAVTYLSPRYDRPKIFYRKTGRALRERFTLAHELGHVLLPWHLVDQVCNTDEQVDFNQANSIEAQANLFASCIMMPDRWLRKIVADAGADGSALLSSIETADLSPSASLIALRRTLPAGWVFERQDGSRVASAGTNTSGLGTIRRLRNRADAEGRHLLHGDPVRWFRLAGSPTLPDEINDGRTAHEVLLAALAILEPDASKHPRIVQSLNGKVGGGLREAERGSAEVHFSTLVYKFTDSDYSAYLDEPLFRQWVGMKARDIAAGTTKKPRRRRT